MEISKEEYISAIINCYKMTREQAEECYDRAIETGNKSSLDFVYNLQGLAAFVNSAFNRG